MYSLSDIPWTPVLVGVAGIGLAVAAAEHGSRSTTPVLVGDVVVSPEKTILPGTLRFASSVQELRPVEKARQALTLFRAKDTGYAMARMTARSMIAGLLDEMMVEWQAGRKLSGAWLTRKLALKKYQRITMTDLFSTWARLTAAEMDEARSRTINLDVDGSRSVDTLTPDTLTPARLRDLENLKHKLRMLVFEEGESPRGEKAVRLLRRTRERIAAHEAPVRAASDAASRKEVAARKKYLRVALSPPEYFGRAEERERYEQLEDLAGGRHRLDQLKRAWESSFTSRAYIETETDREHEERRATLFADRARREDFSPEAVRAFLGAVRNETPRLP